MERDEFLRWLGTTSAPRRRVAPARLTTTRAVRPGDAGSHAAWNALRLHRLIRRMPDSPLRRALQTRLAFELHRCEAADGAKR